MSRSTSSRSEVRAKSTLRQIGAGIEVPPNSTRILRRWNMLEAVKSYSIEPEKLLLRSYRDGSIMSNRSLVPSMEDTYGAPWLLIHRANFQKVLAIRSRETWCEVSNGISSHQDRLLFIIDSFIINRYSHTGGCDPRR